MGSKPDEHLSTLGTGLLGGLTPCLVDQSSLSQEMLVVYSIPLRTMLVMVTKAFERFVTETTAVGKDLIHSRSEDGGQTGQKSLT